MFWISAADTWCSKYRNKALEKRIKTGVHSPGMFRVQGPFSNSPVTRELASCLNFISIVHNAGVCTRLQVPGRLENEPCGEVRGLVREEIQSSVILFSGCIKRERLPFYTSWNERHLNKFCIISSES